MERNHTMSKKELVEFTKEQAKDFITTYNKAVHDDQTQFTFDGREYVRAYAYYIIQWWEMEKFVAGTFDNKKKFTQHDK